MKRLLTILLILPLALLLFACQNGGTDAPSEPPVRIPYMANPGDCTPLTEAELLWFNDEFFGYGGSIQNGLAASFYNAPEEIDLYKTFRLSNENWQQEEKDAVSERYDAEGYIFTKVSAETIYEVLEEHLGLTIAQTDGIGLDRMHYMTEYDAYYFYREDAHFSAVEVYYGERDTEGNVFLFYQYHNRQAPFAFILHLQEQADGSYRFVSNRDDPGISLLDASLPFTVTEAANNIAFSDFYELAAFEYYELPFQPGPALDYRVSELTLADTLTLDGKEVEVYTLRYGMRLQAGVTLPLGEDEVYSADGWLENLLGTYLLYWKVAWTEGDYHPMTWQKAVIHDAVPGDEAFAARVEAILEGRPDIAPDERPEVLSLIFADGEKLLFSTERFLCFYDLATGQIDALVNFDLGRTTYGGWSSIGMNLLRDDGVAVHVTADGWMKDIGMYWQLPKSMQGGGKWFPTEPVRPPDWDSAVAVVGDTGDMSEWPQAVPVERVPNSTPATEGGLTSAEAMPFPDGNGYLLSADGTLAGLEYRQGEQIRRIFDGSFD